MPQIDEGLFEVYKEKDDIAFKLYFHQILRNTCINKNTQRFLFAYQIQKFKRTERNIWGKVVSLPLRFLTVYAYTQVTGYSAQFMAFQYGSMFTDFFSAMKHCFNFTQPDEIMKYLKNADINEIMPIC